MNQSHTALLQKVPMFDGLEPALLQKLAEHSRRRRFEANETVFVAGDPGYTLYIILSGRVRIQTMSANGSIVHHAYRGPGDQFGELSLLDGKPRMADVVTMEPSEFLILNHDDFVRSIESSPRLALQIMVILAGKLRESGELLETYRLDTAGRVARVLARIGSAEIPAGMKGMARLHVRLNQQQIADEIGVARSAVNETLARFKREGILTMDGRNLTGLDLTKLSVYLDG